MFILGFFCDVFDNRGWFFFYEVVVVGYFGCLRSLLEYKNEDFFDFRVYSGEIFFFLVVLNGYVECIKILMEFGVDVNVMNDEEVNLLVVFVKSGSLECLKVCVVMFLG